MRDVPGKQMCGMRVVCHWWLTHCSTKSAFFFLPLFFSCLSEHCLATGYCPLPRLVWQLRLEPRKIGARCGNGVRARRKHIYDLKVLKSSSSDTDGTIRSCGRGKRKCLLELLSQPCPATQAKCSLLIITMAALNLVRGQRWFPTVELAETILSPSADLWSQSLKALSPKMSVCLSVSQEICLRDAVFQYLAWKQCQIVSWCVGAV